MEEGVERNHDRVTRSCRSRHARGDARNGQAAFALVLQSALMILAGILALVYPVVSSVGVVFLLDWRIISGVVQSISPVTAGCL